MAARRAAADLSRRERQIMDIVYQRGEVTAVEVQENLPQPPTYSAVRGLLRVLEEKGHLRHRQDGQRYLYAAVVPREEARRSALDRVLDTFFDGSVAGAVAALLDRRADDLDDDELERLTALIDDAKRKGS